VSTSELRWILLAAGLALIAGVWLWGQRSRRRAATREVEESGARVEPLLAPRASVTARREPAPFEASPDPGEPESLPTITLEDEEPGRFRGTPAAVPLRREPRLEAELPEATVNARLIRGAGSSGPAPAAPQAAPEPRAPSRSTAPPAPDAPSREASKPQKILAIRIVPGVQGPFEGRALRAAAEAAGFEYGRYRIFHRLDASGQPLCSLASLKEPGTFDLEVMDEGTFRGVALFAVLPGAVPAGATFDAMLAAAQAIAAGIGGVLQDERGVPLVPARAARLRDEAIALERALETASGD
jgi:cell division protein ZipA